MSASQSILPLRADAAGAAYATIHQMLLSGEFEAGTPIYETVLGPKLGYSRTPVREALGLLHQDGLIDRSTRGYTVKTLTPAEIIEVLDVRATLDERVVQQAARNITPFEIYKLRELNEEAKRLIDEAEKCSDEEARDDVFRAIHERNHEWHLVLLESCKNTTLIRVLTQLMNLQMVYNPRMTVHDVEPFQKTLESHIDLLSALEKRDPETSLQLMTEHSDSYREARIAEFMHSESRA